MMLINNRKESLAKNAKTEPEFDSILEQVPSLDTQKKVSKSRSMKSTSNAKEAKKTPSSSTLSCPYQKKSGHTEDKCCYKHLKQTSEGFCERFKTRIVDLKSCIHSVKSSQNEDTEIVNDDCPREYMV